MLNRIKTLLSIADNSKDELLTTLIDQAISQFISYTNNPDKVCMLDSLIAEMVVYMYNRLGTEGLASEGYSGVSFNYLTDYPETILRAMRAYKKVKVIGK